MSEIAKERALVMVDQAQRQQFRGQFSEAIQLYRRSIDLFPTAEAYTYLGWTYSMMQRFEDAIDACESAIEVDPGFGNPYNDIGAYLIELGRHEESVPWFERAITAERYDERQFPYINLGRVYEHLGKYRTALDYYNKALEEDPFSAGARLGKYGLLGRMN